jgi:chromosome segregation ATPase
LGFPSDQSDPISGKRPKTKETDKISVDSKLSSKRKPAKSLLGEFRHVKKERYRSKSPQHSDTNIQRSKYSSQSIELASHSANCQHFSSEDTAIEELTNMYQEEKKKNLRLVGLEPQIDNIQKELNDFRKNYSEVTQKNSILEEQLDKNEKEKAQIHLDKEKAVYLKSQMEEFIERETKKFEKSEFDRNELAKKYKMLEQEHNLMASKYDKL